MFALLSQLDRAVFLWIVDHRFQPLSELMREASGFGNHGMIWFIFALALAGARRLSIRGFVVLALAIALASAMTDQYFKPLFGRERPFVTIPQVDVMGKVPDGRSFPSGHTTNAFAGAYVLTHFVPEGRVIWWATAAAIGYSRIYRGVHYPVDVAGGALVGLLCGWLLSFIAERLVLRRRSPRPTSAAQPLR